LIINFAGDRYSVATFRSSAVVEGAKGAQWKSQGLLLDKIVLLGGRYRAGRDEYSTPVGSMFGVVLLGQVIASELHGGGIRLGSEFLMILMELTIGVLVVFINYRLPVGPALLVSLVAIPSASMIASYAVFSTLAYSASFVPVCVAVWIHQLYDRANEYHALLRTERVSKATSSPKIVSASKERPPDEASPA
jgi:hypothetical protein